MALRDWTVRRILTLWAGWFAGLFLLLLAGVVLSPSGVSISVSPAGLPLVGRVVLGLLGLIAASLPPTVLTYVWYVGRLRAWGEGRSTATIGQEPVLPTSPPTNRRELDEVRERLTEIEERLDVAHRLITELRTRQELPRP